MTEAIAFSPSGSALVAGPRPGEKLRCICKIRTAANNDQPLDSPLRDCLHDDGPWGPWCNRMKDGFCRNLIRRVA